METSIFLAKLIGIVSGVTALGILGNLAWVKKSLNDFLKRPALAFYGGVLSLTVTTLLVLVHNVWEGWPIIITLIAWLGMIKAALLILIPEQIMKTAKKFNNETWFVTAGILWLAISVILLYFGFSSVA